jgi:hypothetical protein
LLNSDMARCGAEAPPSLRRNAGLTPAKRCIAPSRTPFHTTNEGLALESIVAFINLGFPVLASPCASYGSCTSTARRRCLGHSFPTREFLRGHEHRPGVSLQYAASTARSGRGRNIGSPSLRRPRQAEQALGSIPDTGNARLTSSTTNRAEQTLTSSGTCLIKSASPIGERISRSHREGPIQRSSFTSLYTGSSRPCAVEW